MAIKITKNMFAGGANLASTVYRDPNSPEAAPDLANILRSLVRENARMRCRIGAPGFTGFDTTISSDVDPYSPIPDLMLPTTPVNASSGGGASKTEFDNAMTNLETTLARLMAMNSQRAYVAGGINLHNMPGGTSLNELPEMTLPIAAASGASAISFDSALATFTFMKRAILTLVEDANRFALMIGAAPVPYLLEGVESYDQPVLPNKPDTAAYAGGVTAMSTADVNDFLDTVNDILVLLTGTYFIALFSATDSPIDDYLTPVVVD